MFSPDQYHLIPLYANKRPCWHDEWPPKPGPLPFISWPALTGKQANDWIAGGGLIGLVCGGDMGIYCLDIDTKDGRIPPDTQDWLVENIAWLNTLHVTTASGGSHYIYEHGGAEIPGRNLRSLGLEADFKGQGGFIVLHSPLKQYEVGRIGRLPIGLLELVQRPTGEKGRADTQWDGGEIPEGQRNDVISAQVWRMLKRGYEYADVKAAAIGLAVQCGLPISEVLPMVERAAVKIAQEAAVIAAPLFHSIDDIQGLKLPPIERVCGPLHSAGVTMIAGAAGVGKSLFALNMAAHMAAGVDFESWKVPRAQRVLYVDGEMAPQYLQGRTSLIIKSDNLKFLHLGLMNELQFYVDFSQKGHQAFFLDSKVFDQFDVFVFDTVSALIQGNKDVDLYSPQYWLQIEPFHQRFRAVGKTVIWVDNLNKEGKVFGTSAKHHKVDSMWLFEPLKNPHRDATAAFVMSQNKMRGDTDEAKGKWEYFRNYGWRIQ